MARTGANSALSIPPETLAARALRGATADARIAGMKRQLRAAREELLHRDNEILSLRHSLELAVAENFHLSTQLAESSAAADDVLAQLEDMKSALSAADVERDEAAERAKAAAVTLSGQLGAVSTRAALAEKTLSDARQCLRSCIGMITSAEQRATIAESVLANKQHELEELEKSYTTLVKDIDLLQEISKTREADLARANAKLGRLSDVLAAKKEPKAGAREQTAESAVRLVIQAAARRSAALDRDLAKDSWLITGS
jgi:chromosome segregation ATPase